MRARDNVVVEMAKRERTRKYVSFGQKLVEWRAGREIETVVRRVQRMGLALSAATLRGLEYGWVRSPDPMTLLALARVYGQSFEAVCDALFDSRQQAGEGKKIPKHSGAATPVPTSIEGFVALPLLADSIAAGQPLAIAPDPDRDRTLSFRETVVRKFTRPICLRIGPREESMLPTLEPGDVLVIDQNTDRRRAPKAGHIYAVNFGPLTGDDGGTIKRIDLSGSTLVVTSDNMDKRAYPPQVFNVTDTNLLDVLVGEVVWAGRYLGSGKKADGQNMKRAGAKTR